MLYHGFRQPPQVWIGYRTFFCCTKRRLQRLPAGRNESSADMGSAVSYELIVMTVRPESEIDTPIVLSLTRASVVLGPDQQQVLHDIIIDLQRCSVHLPMGPVGSREVSTAVGDPGRPPVVSWIAHLMLKIREYGFLCTRSMASKRHCETSHRWAIRLRPYIV